MLNYEEIREMPLCELLEYYNALRAIYEKHEVDLKPLYNSNNPKDQMKWVEVNNELQYTKKYFDVVLNALKYKAFHGLDEYKRKDKTEIGLSNSKPKPKKPIRTAPSRRTSVKKKDK